MPSCALVAMKAFIVLSLAAASRPDIQDKPGTARWMVNQATWGVIATTSIRLNGTAFGNPIAVAELNGQPYFYVSLMDESMKDIQKTPGSTLSLSEASLDCASLKIDPEDPRCTRLSLSGKMLNVSDQAEYNKAKAALFDIHPSMKSWPVDHNWLMYKLDIEQIWLIDYFGGAANVSIRDYYAVKEQPRGRPASPAHKPTHKQPLYTKKADTARWLIHEATWGTFATTSVHLNSLAFANPVSLVDGTESNATGTPYFLISTLDASAQDIAKYPKFSLTVSQAEVNCALDGISGAWDPEDPRCTRLTLTGTMAKVTDVVELAFAKEALVAKHPAMADWIKMASHDFSINKMSIEEVWLIDFFGGASYITVADYYKASEAAKYFSQKKTAAVIV